jgi:DNA-binding CsgD family transcriptional regulator
MGMASKPDLLGLVDRVYEAATDVGAWPAALAQIADALAARTTNLHVVGPAPGRSSFLVAPRTDPDWLRVFVERWAAHNIVRDRGIAFPEGVVYRFADLMPRSEFDRSEFYHEFWRPQRQEHGLFVNIVKGRDASAGVGFYRSAAKGPFEAEEERLLRRLAPHLRRAVTVNLKLGRIGMARDAVAETLTGLGYGALLVDDESRILFANAAAERLLRNGTGLRSEGGRLGAVVAAETTALRALITGSGGVPGGELALAGGNGEKLSVLVVPARAHDWRTATPAAAIVLVREPAMAALPAADEIRRLFGLTRAQAALAREILQGDGIDAAARRLGIARATARSHLLEVFQRTGTGRQAELVRVILHHTIAVRRIP